jgi:hypothetical protein
MWGIGPMNPGCATWAAHHRLWGTKSLTEGDKNVLP